MTEIPTITADAVVAEITAGHETLDALANRFAVNHSNGELRHAIAAAGFDGRIERHDGGWFTLPGALEAPAETAAMTRDELSAWLRLRGVPDGQLATELDRYAGKTEDEMDAIYDAQHGSIA